MGVDSAATLLTAAADNLELFRSDAGFAALCGVSPLPASSGKTNRHRLNRGGNRQANAPLHRIAVVRLRWDEQTQAYAARRTEEGLSKPEICAASNGSLPGRFTGFCWAVHRYAPEGPEKPGAQKPRLPPSSQPARSPVSGWLLGGLRAGRCILSTSANRKARGELTSIRASSAKQ
ncbi:transposase [Synechococcus sp. CBW1108]|uniref:transposase n=1 Tax=Synechococcus sp. CBW1108 TaxID=1353147 RepID=UPI00351C1B64